MEELSTYELITAVFIHFVIPILGIVFYLILLNRMKKTNIQNPPNVALFLEFFIYGGLLLIILTSQFWYWSFMALIGSIFLVFIAPIVMLGISLFYLWKRNQSTYHKLTFYSALFYIPILIATYFILINIDA